jgi:beta-lactamase regulating signal transducer with metallopeptidase domain/HEAT repeat protein
MTTSQLFSGVVPLALFVAKATLVLIVAAVATIPLRRGTAGSRHLVWLAALVSVLALPLLSRVNVLRIGVLPSSLAINTSAVAPLAVTTPRAVVAPAIARPAPAARHEQSVTSAPRRAVAPAFAAASMSMLSALALVWSVVALALVGWLAFGTIAVRRIVATSRELTSPDWTTPLCEVADRLDLEFPPRLVISDEIEMAFACRALMPTIVLPVAAESWSDDRRRAVLFHELAHIKRHDLVGHTLGRLACALYWFHPLVWSAAKNLRAESERACDDLVLSCGARPSEYAQHLLEMITSVRNHGAPIMALPMARRKEFEGRMLAILDPAIRRSSPGRLQSAAVVGTISVLSLTVSAVAPAAARTESVSQAPVAVVAHMASPAAPRAIPLPAPRAARETTTNTPATHFPAPVHEVVEHAAPPSHSPMQEAPSRDANPNSSPHAAAAIVAGHRREVDTARVAMLVRILLNDPDAHVRRTAAWGLSELHTLGARDALVRALRSDNDSLVREMAAWSLADYHGDDVLAALADGLHDTSVKVRLISAWGLGETASRKSLGDLEGALSDPDDQVREIAIWAIGEMNIKSAPVLVINALTDNSERIRLVAAWAMGEIADKSTASAVISAFQTETSNEVRRAEIRALAEMGKMSQAVVDVALKSTDPALRRYAVAALAGEDVDRWSWPRPRPRPNP